MKGQQQYLNRLRHSSDDWLVLTGPKCAKEVFPIPLHQRHQPGLLKQGRFGPWIHAVGIKFWLYHLYASAEIEIHQTRLGFFQSSPVQFWWACAHCSLSFLFLAERIGTRRCLLPFVAHPSWGSTRCAFCDAFLLTTVVQSRGVIRILKHCGLSQKLFWGAGVSKCPWARHLTPNCSWRAGWYLAWQPIAVGVWMCLWMGEWEAKIVKRFA